MSTPRTVADAARCLSEYDPDALPVDSARRLIAAMIDPVTDIESVPLRASLDRVLASDVISPIDVPAHDNAAMDGFAMRSVDLSPSAPTRLRIVGTALAGRRYDARVSPGETVRIMTGAVMPDGLDTVVPQELVEVDANTVAIPPGQASGQHRRLRGEDLTRGRPAIEAGKILRPAELGLLASLAVAEVPVRRRLRVAYFSTGDELRSIGEALGEGEIYDSNRYTLFGMLSRLGVELIDLGVVRDRPEELERTIREAAGRADAIFSSGGVSVGEADYTREVMRRVGDVAFWKIAMRPGRPMAFGRVGKAYYFGLPGNPVAVMITFYFFAREALLRMMGARVGTQPVVRARTLEALRKKPGRTEYQRGILSTAPDGTMQVRITGSQGSGVLRSMSEANCIVVLHHEQGSTEAGHWVDCLAFEGLI